MIAEERLNPAGQRTTAQLQKILGFRMASIRLLLPILLILNQVLSVEIFLNIFGIHNTSSLSMPVNAGKFDSDVPSAAANYKSVK